MNHAGRADRPAADHRPARGLRLGRALRAPLPGHRRRGADPLAPAPQLLRAPREGRRAARSCRPSARSPVPVALDNEREYRLAEEDVIAWLREQPLDLRELESKVAAALRAERLAQLNALRRLAVARQGRRGAGLDRRLPRLRRAARRLRRPPRDPGPRCVERFPDALHLLGRDSIARARGRRCSAFQAGRVAAARVRHARRPARASRSRAPPTSPSSTSSGRPRCTTRPRTAATGSASTTR